MTFTAVDGAAQHEAPMEQDEKEKLRIRECREEYEAKRRVWEQEAAERQAQRELAERIITVGRKGLVKQLNRFGRDHEPHREHHDVPQAH
jgi:hypothetical protein